MHIKVCIPHYFKEHKNPIDNPKGYGSLRSGSKLARSIAFSQCINKLISLQRKGKVFQLNHHKRKIDTKTISGPDLTIDIFICTDGKNYLSDIINMNSQFINHIIIKSENPRDLPLHARDYLLQHTGDYDLFTYMEDDILIHDAQFFDKQFWFTINTGDNLVLMPHRYEIVPDRSANFLLVDGPLPPDFIELFQESRKNVGTGKFKGIAPVSFDQTNNPHSGTFTISRNQKIFLDSQELPVEGFVSQLETAATLTVLKYFKVLKPSIENWDFLTVEHGHASFLDYIKQLPHEDLEDSSATI